MPSTGHPDGKRLIGQESGEATESQNESSEAPKQRRESAERAGPPTTHHPEPPTDPSLQPACTKFPKPTKFAGMGSVHHRVPEALLVELPMRIVSEIIVPSM